MIRSTPAEKKEIADNEKILQENIDVQNDQILIEVEQQEAVLVDDPIDGDLFVIKEMTEKDKKKAKKVKEKAKAKAKKEKEKKKAKEKAKAKKKKEKAKKKKTKSKKNAKKKK